MKRSERIEAMRGPLLAWYRAHRRDLPWRRSRDPYAIWVSEIMLQQTRVETVRLYYDRFLTAFPDVESLARAQLDDVLKLWEGLGYYGRARNLHRAARVVADESGGALPESVDALRRLPGIGGYTAGAIASIAFGLDEPVVDGNVMRVLSRVFRVRSPVSDASTQRSLWRLARALIPPNRAGEMNQAVMDLGATVCRARAPACGRCPIAELCQARVRGEEEELPRKAARKPLPHDQVAVGVVRKHGRILIGRRPEEGLLGGLWEFPGGKQKPRETPAACAVREIREEVGVAVEIVEKLTVVEHAYSHFRVTIHAFLCNHTAGRPRPIGCVACKWIRLAEADRYAFPAATHKILAALRDRSSRAKARKGGGSRGETRRR